MKSDLFIPLRQIEKDNPCSGNNQLLIGSKVVSPAGKVMAAALQWCIIFADRQSYWLSAKVIHHQWRSLWQNAKAITKGSQNQENWGTWSCFIAIMPSTQIIGFQLLLCVTVVFEPVDYMLYSPDLTIICSPTWKIYYQPILVQKLVKVNSAYEIFRDQFLLIFTTKKLHMSSIVAICTFIKRVPCCRIIVFPSFSY